MVNGVTKYTHRADSSCEYDKAVTGRTYNHKKWTLSLKGVHTVDNVKVSFATADKSATLKLAQDNGAAVHNREKKMVLVTKRNVKLSDLEVAVLEEGTPLCAVEQGCNVLLQALERAEMSPDAEQEEGGGGVNFGIIISIIGLIFIGGTLTIAFIAIRCIGKE